LEERSQIRRTRRGGRLVASGVAPCAPPPPSSPIAARPHGGPTRSGRAAAVKKVALAGKADSGARSGAENAVILAGDSGRGRFSEGTGRQGMQIQCRVIRAAAAALACMALLAPASARAQSNAAFGVQQRADAAQQMILLGVSQGVSSLPPTSGQSFVYEFDEALDTYKATGLLGPTAYRS